MACFTFAQWYAAVITEVHIVAHRLPDDEAKALMTEVLVRSGPDGPQDAQAGLEETWEP
jgi:hypothetical protein